MLTGVFQCHTPATLSDDMKRCLESLMLEGDLLEVTLPETQTIWRILQSTQPIKDKKYDVWVLLSVLPLLRLKPL